MAQSQQLTQHSLLLVQLQERGDNRKQNQIKSDIARIAKRILRGRGFVVRLVTAESDIAPSASVGPLDQPPSGDVVDQQACHALLADSVRSSNYAIAAITGEVEDKLRPLIGLVVQNLPSKFKVNFDEKVPLFSIKWTGEGDKPVKAIFGSHQISINNSCCNILDIADVSSFLVLPSWDLDRVEALLIQEYAQAHDPKMVFTPYSDTQIDIRYI